MSTWDENLKAVVCNVLGEQPDDVWVGRYEGCFTKLAEFKKTNCQFTVDVSTQVIC